MKISVGGRGGHLLRRGIHVGMVAIPWLYHVHGDRIGAPVGLQPVEVAAAFGLAFILIEILRLKIGFTMIGQREYERHQVSALAWGAVSIALVFVAMHPWEAERVGFLSVPLILCLVFGDPAMGEARRAGLKAKAVFGIGAAVCALVWLACWHQLGTPLWLVPLMAVLTPAAEWPVLKWIDDNATMTLIPLGAILLIVPFL